MIPVGNFLQVIILIVHRDSPCHIPQQRQPKGAESEPEPGTATGDHRVLSQEPPLRVPELLFGERASRARAAGKALRERQGKEPEAGAAPREPLRDRAAGPGQRGTAGHSDRRSDRRSDRHSDTGPARPARGRWDPRLAASLPCPAALGAALSRSPSCASFRSGPGLPAPPARSSSKRALIPRKVNLAGSLLLPARVRSVSLPWEMGVGTQSLCLTGVICWHRHPGHPGGCVGCGTVANNPHSIEVIPFCGGFFSPF